MPEHSSFYVSPKGFTVCMTLTRVSKKQRILIELCAHLSLCGSERIGFIRWVFGEEKGVWQLVLILSETLWIQNTAGALMNTHSLAWMYTRARMPKQSCVRSMLCVTASLFPSLEISCCINVYILLEEFWIWNIWIGFECIHMCYFLQWGQLYLTFTRHIIGITSNIMNN